jgi:hypothetical protein
VITFYRTELGATSGERGFADAKGPPTHHAAAVNVTYIRVSIWVAHRTCSRDRKKFPSPWEHILESCQLAQHAGRFSAPSFQPVEKPPKQQSVGSYNTRCCKAARVSVARMDLFLTRERVLLALCWWQCSLPHPPTECACQASSNTRHSYGRTRALKRLIITAKCRNA